LVGATTRIRALVDAEGHPIRLTLTEGQAHDGRSVADMLETLEAGHILLAGCACDSVHMAANLQVGHPERDAIGLNRITLLSLCLGMIFSENRCPLFRIML
jgi:hypothetical protein